MWVRSSQSPGLHPSERHFRRLLYAVKALVALLASRHSGSQQGDSAHFTSRHTDSALGKQFQSGGCCGIRPENANSLHVSRLLPSSLPCMPLQTKTAPSPLVTVTWGEGYLVAIPIQLEQNVPPFYLKHRQRRC